MFCTAVTKERVVIKLACQEEADMGEQRGGMMMLRSNNIMILRFSWGNLKKTWDE